MPMALRFRGLAWVLLLCTLSACSSSPEPAPPYTSTLEVELTEVLTIGLETHDGDLLGAPAALVTGQEGQMFVADRSIPAVRVFDADGQWQHDIGKRGEGPVEFTSLNQLTLIGPDTLLAVDGMAMRATVVTTSGVAVDHWPLVTIEGGSLVILSALKHLDERHLVVGWNTVSNNPADDHPTEVLHYVRRTDEGYHIEQQFLDPAEAYDFEGYGRSARPTGSALLLDDTTLLFAHQLYTGRIESFIYDEDSGAWTQEAPWPGVVSTEMPYENVPDEAYPGPNISRAGSPAGLFHARIFNRSAGLVTLPDERIAHFTRIKVDGEEQFGMELFERSGERVGYAAIWRRPYREEPTSLPYVDHVDADGRLYLRTTDEATGAPVVQVLQLSVSE